MRKSIIVVILMTFLFCSCGKSNNDAAPILNENGKEEIVLSISRMPAYMENVIVNYNKQSDKYEIVVREYPDLFRL